ncbi:MAG: hypothetical protein WC229_02335 [Candidatus Paceibacterota bacterium]|jgi:hypothetical protein
MKKTVFYSWQSDLPNGTNRTLIENALKEAAKEIGDDSDTDIEPVIDRDTQGVAGAPNIATAIFEKIDSADLFVADVSIIGSAKKRAVPNPNVLIELGYALKALRHERIILVFNNAFGKVERLPFDLRMHRTLTYSCTESVTDRSEIKKDLIKDFKSALLVGFSHVASKKTATPIIDIIKNNTPSKKIELRTHLTSVLNDLEKFQSPMKRDGGTVEELLASIPKTENISMEFSKLIETIVLMNDMDSAKEVFQWFGKILTKYDPILEAGGQTWNCDGDYYKFMGHELFVNFVTLFLREEKWSELKELLKIPLQVGPTQHHINGRKESWTKLSEHSPWILDEGKTRGRVSPHGDLLKNRHENGELASVIPFKEFTETDFFLHLYGEGQTQDRYYGPWYPRSDIWLHDTPKFVSEMVDYPTAIKICSVLQISDVDELKRRLTHLTIHWDWHSPISDTDIAKIGTIGGAQIIHA